MLQTIKLKWLKLKDYFGDKKINILEIGTFNGNFSNFLSKVYSESQIITIDLDENEEIKVINVIHLSLTFDHRALDGVPASNFLDDLVKNIESI